MKFKRILIIFSTICYWNFLNIHYTLYIITQHTLLLVYLNKDTAQIWFLHVFMVCENKLNSIKV